MGFFVHYNCIYIFTYKVKQRAVTTHIREFYQRLLGLYLGYLYFPEAFLYE